MRSDISDRIVIEADGIKSGEASVKVGAAVPATALFKQNDLVDVTGVSKGKGFQGGVKRHGFAGGPKTHGQSDRWRAPGSMGATTTPGRTFKGQRMAGRMGTETVTVRNLKVLAITDTSITIQGLVPGVAGGIVVVRLAH
jgi:large subunit ribosomal protein L3